MQIDDVGNSAVLLPILPSVESILRDFSGLFPRKENTENDADMKELAP